MSKTLLEMAGANLTPARWQESALLLIDCQKEYTEGKLLLDNIDSANREVRTLLDAARVAGAPVIHIAHEGKAGGLFDQSGIGGQIIEGLTPIDNEIVINKGFPNAFAGTNLKDVFDQTGRAKLTVAGYMTHMCVSSTVRAALDLGIGCTVVAGATATRALPRAGEDVPAHVIQDANLAALADRFAVIAERASDIPD